MKPCRPALVALLLAALASSPAFAQLTPDAVTDAQVSLFQSSIEEGCIRRGTDKHDPEQALHESCTCEKQVLQARLTKAEWQAAVAAAFNGNRQGAMDIIGKHKEELMACKPAQ
ncbi:MAG TPA: hypothetical protein VIP05_05920 [Burkholderiaceae bacterium]